MRVSQYCLEQKKIEGVLNDIPKAIVIKELTWEWWQRGIWRRLEISALMKRKGFKTISECSARVKASGKFTDMSREDILETVEKIARMYKLDSDAIIIKKLTLGMGKEEAMFRQIIKRSGEKFNKKIPVLGLVSKTSDKILEQLSIKKMYCKVMKIEKTIAICSDTE